MLTAGNIFLVFLFVVFCFHVVKPVMPNLPILCVCKKKPMYRLCPRILPYKGRRPAGRAVASYVVATRRRSRIVGSSSWRHRAAGISRTSEPVGCSSVVSVGVKISTIIVVFT